MYSSSDLRTYSLNQVATDYASVYLLTLYQDYVKDDILACSRLREKSSAKKNCARYTMKRNTLWP